MAKPTTRLWAVVADGQRRVIWGGAGGEGGGGGGPDLSERGFGRKRTWRLILFNF